MATSPTPGPYATDPRLQEPSSYSRQDCIDAIRELLHYLCDRLPYLDRAWIQEPTADGWPNINPQTCAPLGKTEEVTHLLARLPYATIPYNGPYARHEHHEYYWPAIKRETYLYNFHGELYQAALAEEANGTSLSGDFTYGFGCPNLEIPPWVICLTNGRKHDDYLLLDTSAGTVTRSVPFPGYADPPDYADDDPRRWRDECADETLPVKEYFERLMRELEDQVWLPYFEKGRPTMMWELEDPDMTEYVKSIYREYGWPHEFRRDQCRQALLAWDGRRIPKAPCV